MSSETFKKNFDVSRETLSHFHDYEKLLKKWNSKTNLISKNTISHIWCRHFLDSAQIINYCQPDNKLWLDIGSGAGFPGVVISILLKDMRIKSNVVLVEKNNTKAIFLKEVRRNLNLSYDIINKRIEDIKPLNADIVSARAFSPLNLLLPISIYHGKKSAISIFLKGKNLKEEIDKTSKKWFFHYDIFNSISSDKGKIIKIKDLKNLLKGN